MHRQCANAGSLNFPLVVASPHRPRCKLASKHLPIFGTLMTFWFAYETSFCACFFIFVFFLVQVLSVFRRFLLPACLLFVNWNVAKSYACVSAESGRHSEWCGGRGTQQSVASTLPAWLKARLCCSICLLLLPHPHLMSKSLQARKKKHRKWNKKE